MTVDIVVELIMVLLLWDFEKDLTQLNANLFISSILKTFAFLLVTRLNNKLKRYTLENKRSLLASIVQ